VSVISPNWPGCWARCAPDVERPGGIGKTRLAIRLARHVIAAGTGTVPDSGSEAAEGTWAAGDLDEAWLVELADWRGQTAQHVAATIGVREEPGVPLAQTLAEALRSRTCCSSSIPASIRSRLRHARPVPAGPVPGAADRRDQREPLRVRGETVWRVPPLDLPPQGADGASLPPTRRSGCSRPGRGARPGFT